MASSIQAYNITVTNGNTNSTPADGFIDSKKIENYVASLETTPMSLTIALCKAKRRGNVRYNEMIRQIQLMANCYVDPLTIAATGASALLEASAFTFQIWAEHGDGSLITADENNAGQFLTSTAAITRCIARALTSDLFKQIDIVDPTSADTLGTPGSTTSAPRQTIRILPDAANTILEIGAYANSLSAAAAMISVTSLL